MKNKIQGQFSNPIISHRGSEYMADRYEKNKHFSEKADHDQENIFLGE
jgi:hypothetical protein